MGQDFFPDRESDVPGWSYVFLTGISADPQAVGLDPTDVDRYADLHLQFMQRYQASNDPVTRTIIANRLKREALQALEDDARRLSRIIQAVGLTPADKMALGLSPSRGGGNRPATGAPQSAPGLVAGRTAPFVVTVRLRDHGSTRRGRPRGVHGAAVYVALGAPGATEPGRFEFHGLTVETTYDVTFPTDAAPGSVAWVCARWLSPRLEAGGAGPALWVQVPMGTAVPAPAVRAAGAARAA